MKNYGKKAWLIPDGFLSSKSTGQISHESVCVLNTSSSDAHINLTLFFEDRDPQGNFKAVCPSNRTNHIRMDKLKNEAGEPVPLDVPYAILAESDVEIVAQYSRLDTSQP